MRQRRPWNRLAWGCGIVLAVAGASPARAELASALIREGDTVPGQGDVTSINNPMVNHASGYAVTLNTVGGTTLSHVWGHASGGAGAVLFTEGTYAGYEQTSFESFAGLSDTGEACYSATANELPAGPNGLDTVWVDATPVLVEEQAVASLPGQFSTFNSRPAILGNGTPHWVGGISTIQGGATQNRVLFLGYGAAPLFAGGDPVGGVVEAAQVNTGGVDFNYRFSELGTHWIMEVLVQSSSTNDGVVVVDGAAQSAGGGQLREATTVSPAAGGLPGEHWASFDSFGINEDGTIFVTGDTDAAATEDEFVLLGEQIALREGAVLSTPGGNVTVSGAIESAYMNEQTDWAATWDVTLGDATNVEALIFNGEVVLLEGDPVDLDGDGAVEPGSILSDFTGISSLVVADRDVFGAVAIYFTADVDTDGTSSTTDDTEALFRLIVPSGNLPPVAVCDDRVVAAGASCTADASVDAGSFDPDGDPITIDQTPPGPYDLGMTLVELTVTDDGNLSDTCSATVTVVPEPLSLGVSRTEIVWGPKVCDLVDLVRGDLGSLLATSGDYSIATVECLADDTPATSIGYVDVPVGSGEGYWFLARRVSAGGNDTYDSGGPGQQGGRDAGVAASGADCR